MEKGWEGKDVGEGSRVEVVWRAFQRSALCCFCSVVGVSERELLSLRAPPRRGGRLEGRGGVEGFSTLCVVLFLLCCWCKRERIVVTPGASRPVRRASAAVCRRPPFGRGATEGFWIQWSQEVCRATDAMEASLAQGPCPPDVTDGLWEETKCSAQVLLSNALPLRDGCSIFRLP